MHSQELYRDLSSLQARVSQYKFKMVLIYLRGYLEDLEQKCLEFLGAAKMPEELTTEQIIELATAYYDIESEDPIYIQKVGKYIEVERLLVHLGFQDTKRVEWSFSGQRVVRFLRISKGEVTLSAVQATLQTLKEIGRVSIWN